jgi:hypothetical protein
VAVALTPNAFLVRNAVGSPSSFSWCGWTRLDTDRNQFTILRYLAANVTGGGGFQFTVDASQKLIVYRANAFVDLLGGAGPTLALGDWWFLGITTIVDDIPNNVNLYRARQGDVSLTQTTVSYSGAYQYANHYVGARPGADGTDGAFRLHGSVERDRVWHGVTLTPSEMLAEYQSETPVKAGAWAVWPMTDAASVIEDATVNNRDLTQTTGTGSVTTTDGPFDTSEVGALSEADALTAASRGHSVTAAALSETDALVAATRASVRAAGPLSETDTLAAVTRSTTQASGPLAESDALAATSRTHDIAAAALTEIDILVATARTGGQLAGVLAEIDQAIAAGHTTTRDVGPFSETDLLVAASHAAARTAGALSELDALHAAGEDEEVGALAEIDTLLSAERTTSRSVAALAETDVLLPATHVTAHTAGLWAEIDVLAGAGDEVLGRIRFVTRSRPLVSATTTAAPTVDMEVSP